MCAVYAPLGEGNEEPRRRGRAYHPSSCHAKRGASNSSRRLQTCNSMSLSFDAAYFSAER